MKCIIDHRHHLLLVEGTILRRRRCGFLVLGTVCHWNAAIARSRLGRQLHTRCTIGRTTGGVRGIQYGVPLFGAGSGNGASTVTALRFLFLLGAAALSAGPLNLSRARSACHFARRELPNNYLRPCSACSVFSITAGSPELVEGPPPVTWLNFVLLFATPSS